MDRYSIFCDIKVSKRPSIVASSLSTERSANSALNFSVFLIENDNGWFLPRVGQLELLLQLGNFNLKLVLLLGIFHRDRLGLAHFRLELADLALQIARFSLELLGTFDYSFQVAWKGPLVKCRQVSWTLDLPSMTLSFRVTSSNLWFDAVATAFASSSSVSIDSSDCSAAKERASPARRPSSLVLQADSVSLHFSMFSCSFAWIVLQSRSWRPQNHLVTVGLFLQQGHATSQRTNLQLGIDCFLVSHFESFASFLDLTVEQCSTGLTYLGGGNGNIELIFDFGDIALDRVDFLFELVTGRLKLDDFGLESRRCK